MSCKFVAAVLVRFRSLRYRVTLKTNEHK